MKQASRYSESSKDHAVAPGHTTGQSIDTTLSSTTNSPQSALLKMQQLHGNQHVQRMLAVQRISDETLNAKADAASGAGGGTATAGRKLDFITMKRKHIHLTGDDKYGHWWTEIDGAKSYGWWPKNPVGLKETLLGTEGELNGQTSFGGTPTTDPHHGDSAEDSFHPVLTDGTKTDAQVRTEIDSFASAYSGEWRWTFGWGQNCHTFQESLMSRVGLVKPSK
jgi:hypothetical protein